MALELPPAASPAAFVAARGAHWPLLRAHTPPPWQQPLLPSIEREIHAVLPLLCTPRCRRARLLLRHGPRRRVAALRPGRQLRAALVSALQRRAAPRCTVHALCACRARRVVWQPALRVLLVAAGRCNSVGQALQAGSCACTPTPHVVALPPAGCRFWRGCRQSTSTRPGRRRRRCWTMRVRRAGGRAVTGCCSMLARLAVKLSFSHVSHHMRAAG